MLFLGWSIEQFGPHIWQGICGGQFVQRGTWTTEQQRAIIHPWCSYLWETR